MCIAFFKLTHNGLLLPEGGALEARNFQFAQNFIRCTTVKLTHNRPTCG